ncbi:uncharacterized protein PgNI_12181 [Pyricularia grisea]|uniref:Uncharacterized protein n=1 Tax=Pyricularia grisea TaxID=148305 RepID=A0A6P8AQV0_PYRGI|nr:uncharacterized protein PgNI_12181 [Pyricularia grisea]TLD04437.1 hypothetical protein PgNI_12181 [Pyricularia grisea]
MGRRQNYNTSTNSNGSHTQMFKEHNIAAKAVDRYQLITALNRQHGRNGDVIARWNLVGSDDLSNDGEPADSRQGGSEENVMKN